LCVVEEPQQIFSIEKSGIYRGLYHVLGGRLSPLSGGNGEDLSTGTLLKRAAQPECKEVILALGADVEGRATAIFLAGLLKDCDVKITRPALGLPAGAGIGYADAATISAAFDGRRDV
ncbi:MAG: recombination protein RecR, partial [Lentisphaeria bacterium]|nr:recombination protein RecR [Lentisphaeria bacterium]